MLLESSADPSTYYNLHNIHEVPQYPHTQDHDSADYAQFIERQQYMYSSVGINGAPLVGREREWPEYASFSKLQGETPQVNSMAMQYLSPTEGYNQDEANFVQNFAVQQQPFLPYPAYLPGFQQQFHNQLYNMYPYVGQYPDSAPYVGPDGQPYFAMRPPDSYASSEVIDPHIQMYQSIGTAMEKLAIKDPQSVVVKQELQQPQSQQHPQKVQQPQLSQQQQKQPQQQQKISKPPNKLEGPRSWADILAAPPTKPTVSAVVAKKPYGIQSSVTGAKPKVEAKAEPRAVHHDDGVIQKKYRAPFDKCNPSSFNWNPSFARFFVIKSYSEDDIHKAIKYNTWASTDSGNRRLDTAYRESSALGPLYLFFSVNASGQFCGMAQMVSPIDYSKKCEYWAQDKWNGQFTLSWIFIKDIPNIQFRHIRLTNNENKPVTNSRDTQEVLLEAGKEILRIFTTYQSKTSILDDFTFYDKRQEIMQEKKTQEVEAPIENSVVTEPSVENLPVPESRKKIGLNQVQTQQPARITPQAAPPFGNSSTPVGTVGSTIDADSQVGGKTNNVNNNNHAKKPRKGKK